MKDRAQNQQTKKKINLDKTGNPQGEKNFFKIMIYVLEDII